VKDHKRLIAGEWIEQKQSRRRKAQNGADLSASVKSGCQLQGAGLEESVIENLSRIRKPSADKRWPRPKE